MKDISRNLYLENQRRLKDYKEDDSESSESSPEKNSPHPKIVSTNGQKLNFTDEGMNKSKGKG